MGAVTTDGTVGKALSVLEQVASAGRPVRMRELLETSEFPKPTLYRFLQTLTNQGMLSYDPEHQTYTPGIRLVRLAHSAWSQATLAPIARPHLETLASTLREAIHLAQMDNGQVIFIDKRQASTQFATLAQAGQVAPAYCTGVGKAMLAFLPEAEREHALRQQAFLKYTDATLTSADELLKELDEIRIEGIAFDREEHEDGIISIAAPILTPSNRVVGSISIATATNRHTLEELNAFRPDLVECANKIGTEAQSWQSPSHP
ncbi:IclR family transcriptional regulator [Sulfitobacter donghicola]|uniref:IclR family transcriptional regulator n=1 Tax=Sulfitobacter donghicola DSW-25 = KCTC 12864 = JCM 14565 TaxID=1300350 RepID=A0A073IGL2_9RHOB|nr:IclR family transcriptional regulator [Sulfitobacter donghicola]KEJ88939.1 IclR family transcriptional regulator [Sulfitobacter donghicola DSW-25 = KCTC 12864 = JCM 14565]KIN67515.1 Transcriptional regulator, IclR family protein [Sulfitobacter donghicola DSW-25 = KCTC 12864 = JCM 14565]